MRKIILVRHGATAGTEARRYSGAGTDEPLSTAGVAALREMRETHGKGMPSCGVADVIPRGGVREAAHRALERVYTSGMARCAQTAGVLFPGAVQVPVPDLREMDFGVFEGKSFADLKDDACYRAWVEAACEPSCPGGESRREFAERCVRGFRSVMAEGDERADEDVREGASERTDASERADASAAQRACGGEKGHMDEGAGDHASAQDALTVFVVHAGTIRALLSELAEPAAEYFSVETRPGGAWACVWDGRALRDATPYDDALSAVNASRGLGER